MVRDEFAGNGNKGGCAFDMEEGAGNGDKRKKRMKKEKNPVINLHALVFFVIAASMSVSSIFIVSGRISTNFTLAPRNTKASAVDTKVYDGMITSSPG